MEREEASPLATSVTLGEDIHRLISDIQGLLVLGMITAVWLILFGVLWVAGLYSWLQILAVVTLISALLFIPLVPLSYKNLKALKKWDEKFIRFSYILKFEILPSENPEPIERIFEQILNVFVELGDIFETNKINHEPYIVAKIKGKKNEHSFDIYIGAQNTMDQEELESFHKENGDLFIRRYAKTTPIGESDLRTLFDEVSDVVKKTKLQNIFGIVAVSTSSFDESARTFVKNKNNWIKRKTADLIEETPQGFRVIWVS